MLDHSRDTLAKELNLDDRKDYFNFENEIKTIDTITIKPIISTNASMYKCEELKDTLPPSPVKDDQDNSKIMEEID